MEDLKEELKETRKQKEKFKKKYEDLLNQPKSQENNKVDPILKQAFEKLVAEINDKAMK